MRGFCYIGVSSLHTFSYALQGFTKCAPRGDMDGWLVKSVRSVRGGHLIGSTLGAFGDCND